MLIQRRILFTGRSYGRHISYGTHCLGAAVNDLTPQLVIHERVLRQQDDDRVRAQNSGLLVRDLRECFAKKLLVVQINISDHAQARFNNVGGVQPAAHANFKHRQLNSSTGKIFKRHSGQHLKKAGMPGQGSSVHKVFGHGLYAVINESKFNITDLLGIYLDSFIHAHQMWGGVESDAIPGGAHNARQRGSSGTFTVSAGNENTLKSPLRMAQGSGEHAHVFQIKFTVGGQLVAQSQELLNSGLVGNRHGLNRLWHHEIECARNICLHFLAIDNRVQHAVLKEKFTRLETIRKFLAYCLLNHARASEANECAWLGDIEITQHGV